LEYLPFYLCWFAEWLKTGANQQYS